MTTMTWPAHQVRLSEATASLLSKDVRRIAVGPWPLVALALAILVPSTFSCSGGQEQLPYLCEASARVVPTASMDGNRIWHTATLLPDGKVLVAGGCNAGWTHCGAQNTTELYDPTTGTFAPGGNLVRPRTHHTATLLASGLVLLAGGGGHEVPVTSSAELYDPATGTSAPTGEMALWRTSHQAVLLADGRVLVLGGRGGLDKSAEVYDPSTHTFTLTGNTSTDARSATLLHDGRVLVVGQDPTWNHFAEVYEPATGAFMPIETASGVGFAAIPLQSGDALVIRDTFDSALVSEFFDPLTNTLTPTGNGAPSTISFTLTLLADGRVLLAGGLVPDGTGAVSNVTEIFDPSTRAYTPSVAMSVVREGNTATRLADGRVLLAGSGSCEMYCEGGNPTVDLYVPSCH